MNDLIAQMERKLEAAKTLAMKRVAEFLEEKIRETLSVVAPTKKVINQRTGVPYTVATTPAVKGAPPRLVSGAMRDSVKVTALGPNKLSIRVTVRAKPNRTHPAGFQYGVYHESINRGPNSGKHKYVRPTVEANRQQIVDIVRTTVAEAMRE